MVHGGDLGGPGKSENPMIKKGVLKKGGFLENWVFIGFCGNIWFSLGFENIGFWGSGYVKSMGFPQFLCGPVKGAAGCLDFPGLDPGENPMKKRGLFKRGF